MPSSQFPGKNRLVLELTAISAAIGAAYAAMRFAQTGGPPFAPYSMARGAVTGVALEEELRTDPKERAEHLMLLDLGRNDVGRVAKFGTVKVTDSSFVERYSHVMHIVSNVEGELRDGVDAVDAWRAGLPAGTVSGAPKVRAMQIIDELEPGQARHLRGRGRLFRLRRQHGHLHRAPRLGGEGRAHARPGRRRHRLRFLPRRGAEGMRRQGAGALPRRGRSSAVRSTGKARAVASAPDQRSAG